MDVIKHTFLFWNFVQNVFKDEVCGFNIEITKWSIYCYMKDCCTHLYISIILFWTDRTLKKKLEVFSDGDSVTVWVHRRLVPHRFEPVIFFLLFLFDIEYYGDLTEPKNSGASQKIQEQFPMLFLTPTKNISSRLKWILMCSKKFWSTLRQNM